VKAVVVHRSGGPDELHLEDVADPEPSAGEVRIAVTAAGTNPVDASNRADGSWARIEFPHVPGYDVAGVIDAMGTGITGMRVGDTVMAMTSFPRGAGGYAEYVVTPADLVATLEPDADLVAAAAVPLAAGTALEVLDRLGLDRGSTLLVLGASGGVGQFLLQLAGHEGVRTIAVGGRSSHERMRDEGAAACIDYTTEDVTQRTLDLAGGQVDAIADLVGGDQLTRSLGALKLRGSAASIATPALDLDAVLDNNITFHGVLISDDGNRTRRLADLLAQGALRPHVRHRLPLAEAAEAHRILESGHAGGKVVLTVRVPTARS
jgi:NADPH:quinone reductase-like Zn-dependent oxidoreductase